MPVPGELTVPVERRTPGPGCRRTPVPGGRHQHANAKAIPSRRSSNASTDPAGRPSPHMDSGRCSSPPFHGCGTLHPWSDLKSKSPPSGCGCPDDLACLHPHSVTAGEQVPSECRFAQLQLSARRWGRGGPVGGPDSGKGRGQGGELGACAGAAGWLCTVRPQVRVPATTACSRAGEPPRSNARPDNARAPPEPRPGLRSDQRASRRPRTSPAAVPPAASTQAVHSSR